MYKNRHFVLFKTNIKYQNKSEQYKKITTNELKEKLQKSINLKKKKKEIQWIEKI